MNGVSGKRPSARAAALCLVVATLAAWPALAQTTGNESGGRVEERFQPEPKPFVVPDAPKSPGIVEPEAPAGAADQFVRLRRIDIEGNTVYSDHRLRRITDPYLRRRISIAEVFEIARKIGTRYRADGWLISRAVVPPQEIDDSVTIRVVEGFIDKIEVEGDFQDRWGRVRDGAAARRLRASRPLHGDALERYLLVVNDLPGISATSVIEKSKTVAGAADLTVLVKSKLLSGAASFDNRGTKEIGPRQFRFGATIANPFGLFGRTSADLILAAPAKELAYYRLRHELPIDGDGSRASVTLSRNESRPGGSTLSTVSVESKTISGQVRLATPLVRSRRSNLMVDGGFTWLDTQTLTPVLTGGTPVELAEDRLRILDAGLTYDFLDGWDGINVFDAHVFQGIPIFNNTRGGSPSDQRGMTRGDAKEDFTRMRLYAARVQSLRALKPSWMANHDINLLLAASGQIATRGLPSSQEFGVGGSRFGRGYDPSEITGDRGFAAKSELQLNYGLPFFSGSAIQFYGFYDFGMVWDEFITGNQQSLASTGAGVRLNLGAHISGNLEMTQPLTRPVAAQESDGNANAPRVYFGLVIRY